MGLYVTLTRRWGETWLSGALRVDREETSSSPLSDYFTHHVAKTTAPRRTAWSASVSAAIPLRPGLRLDVGAGQATRMPSALERFSDRFPSTSFQVAAEFVGDPAAEPEVSRELDLGLSFSGGRVSAQLDTFYRRLEEMITVQVDPALTPRLPLSPPQVYLYVNGTRGEFWGGELVIDVTLSKTLALRLAGHSVRGRDETFGEPAFGMPPLRASARLRWQAREQGPWAEAELEAVARQDRVATARLERPTPGYSTVGVRAGVPIARAWRVTLGVRNVLDRTYSQHLDALDPFRKERVAEPGRSFRLGIERSF